MTVMPAFRFFDPWAELEDPGRPSTTGKVAKSDAAAPQSLASLAGLAALPLPFSGASAKRDELPGAGADRAADIGPEGRVPPIGLPEIPDLPVLLRDGRRLWRFPSAEDCAPDKAAALMDEAHFCGAVLIADGRELIVVERWLSCLPVESLCELRRFARGVIALMRQRSHPKDPRGRFQ
jgi:hypothetical protein